MKEREEVLTPVMQIFAHSCAVSSEGGVTCWGYNYYGQVMFLESALAAACAQVFFADNVFVCSLETALTLNVRRLFKLLG